MPKTPEQQRAFDFFKSFAERAFAEGATLEEMRAAYDALDRPCPENVTRKPVTANGVSAEWFLPDGKQSERVLLYLHGGGFMMGSTRSHRGLISRLAVSAGARALALNYRLTPEFTFPAPIEDVVAAYDWLVEQGTPPGKIVVVGDSAGGGLVLSGLLALRDSKRTMPAGAVLISPWADMELKSDSLITRAAVDPVVQKEGLEGLAAAYLAGASPSNPLASPVLADFNRLPPLLIQVGGDETLLDDSRRLAEKAKLGKVEAHLEIWDDMIHEWHIFADFLPEARQAIERIAGFVRRTTT